MLYLITISLNKEFVNHLHSVVTALYCYGQTLHYIQNFGEERLEFSVGISIIFLTNVNTLLVSLFLI